MSLRAWHPRSLLDAILHAAICDCQYKTAQEPVLCAAFWIGRKFLTVGKVYLIEWIRPFPSVRRDEQDQTHAYQHEGAPGHVLDVRETYRDADMPRLLQADNS